MANTPSKEGIDIKGLKDAIQNAENLVLKNLEGIKSKADSKVDVGELFNMQWMMNKFTQLSEMTSAVIGGAHQAIQAITRNIK